MKEAEKDPCVSIVLLVIRSWWNKETPYPGIGQRPIIQPESGPGLVEKALDRNVIQDSSQVLRREPGEWAPRLQEDGAQAQPHSSGPRMDTEDTGLHLDKGKDIMSRRRHAGDKASRSRLSKVKTLHVLTRLGVQVLKLTCAVKQHTENSNKVFQRNYVQLHQGLFRPGETYTGVPSAPWD